MKNLLYAFILLFSIPSLRASVQKDFTSSMDQVEVAFKARYGNEEIKFDRYGWSMDQKLQKLRKKAIKRGDSLSETEAQILVREFFQSTRDFHVGIYGDNWGGKEAPFRLVEMAGSAFVTAITDPGLTGEMKVGDEILSFDGRSVRSVAQEFHPPKKYEAYFEYESRDANIYMLTRYIAMGLPQPTQEMELLLRHSEQEKPYAVKVSWKDIPVKKSPPLKKMNPNIPESFQSLQDLPLPFQKSAEAPFVIDPFQWGGRVSYFQPGPGTTWQNDPATAKFYAWITLLPNGKRLGSIRIRNFYNNDYGGFVKEFEVLVKKMNEETDMLVLDTLSNTGGSIDYLYGLTSYFFSSKIKTLEFQYRLYAPFVADARMSIPKLEAIKTEAEVTAYFQGDNYNGFPVDLDFVQEMIHFYQGFIEGDAAGDKFGPRRHYNAAFIKPNPRVQYLKPLFVLTDESSVSCGDVFPMLMKDTKRAKIFGRRSAGAGAFSGGQLPLSGELGLTSMSVPFAPGYRLNGHLVEDRGVDPDVWIDVVREDFSHNYAPFREKVHLAIEEEISRL